MAKLNFDPDSPIINKLYELCSMLWMNVLWFFFSLPLVTLGASTAAFYRMMFNIQDKKVCSARAFWEAFRENFKKATVLWLMILGSAAVLLLSFPLLQMLESGAAGMVLRVPQFLLLMAVAIVMIYAFPLCAFFDNTVGNTLKNALLMGLFHLGKTIPCLLLALVIPVVMFAAPYFFIRLLPLWVFVVPSILTYAISLLLRKVFQQYVPKSEE